MSAAALARMLNPTAPARTSNGFVATDWDRLQGFARENGHVDLSLVLPTYNDRKNLGELFAWIDDTLIGVCFEAIVVDHDSPDGTWAAARELEPQYPWLRVIRRRNDSGFGSAVVCGFRHARGNILAVLDSNSQHHVDLLPELLQKMKRADFAVATRCPAGACDGKWSKMRRFASFVVTALARPMAHVPFSDATSRFFLMRRGIFQAIDGPDLRPRGYKILVYLYTKAVHQFGRHALALAEIGYEFSNRAHGRRKLSIRIIADYFLMLFGLRPHREAQIHPRGPRWSHAAF